MIAYNDRAIRRVSFTNEQGHDCFIELIQDIDGHNPIQDDNTVWYFYTEGEEVLNTHNNNGYVRFIYEGGKDKWYVSDYWEGSKGYIGYAYCPFSRRDSIYGHFKCEGRRERLVLNDLEDEIEAINNYLSGNMFYFRVVNQVEKTEYESRTYYHALKDTLIADARYELRLYCRNSRAVAESLIP